MLKNLGHNGKLSLKINFCVWFIPLNFFNQVSQINDSSRLPLLNLSRRDSINDHNYILLLKKSLLKKQLYFEKKFAKIQIISKNSGKP